MRAGRTWLVLCVAAPLGAVGAGLSCIADLPPDEGPADSSPAPPLGLCGNGYIDLAAHEECDPGLPGPWSPSCTPPDAGQGACKMVCSGLKWPGNDHCYELEPSKALATEARDECVELFGGHVATFASDDEFTNAATYARVSGAASFWVGLQDDSLLVRDSYAAAVAAEPGWAPSCPGCYAHTQDPAVPLRSVVRPDGGGSACVLATTDVDASWASLPCDGTDRIRVLCEREPLGVYGYEDAGYQIDLVYTFGAKHYTYFGNMSDAVTAAAAESRCEELGGTLVVFQSRDEREQLWYELSRVEPPPNRIWIGLGTPDGGAPGSWRWDDGTPDDGGYPPEWAIGEPESGAGHAVMTLAGATAVSNTLAQGASPSMTAPFVCQFVLPDAGR